MSELDELRTNCRQWYDQNIDLIQQRDAMWRENQDLRAMARRAIEIAWSRAILDRSGILSRETVDEIVAAARGLALPPARAHQQQASEK